MLGSAPVPVPFGGFETRVLQDGSSWNSRLGRRRRRLPSRHPSRAC